MHAWFAVMIAVVRQLLHASSLAAVLHGLRPSFSGPSLLQLARKTVGSDRARGDTRVWHLQPN